MTTLDRQHLLYGHEPTERIVAVERTGRDRIRVFRRLADGRITSGVDDLHPWVIVTNSGAATLAGHGTPERLTGDLPLRHRFIFSSWGAYLDGVQILREKGLPYQTFPNPVDQYLTATGRTLFKGMTFDDLVRLQLDIETAGLDATQEGARVLVIALATNHGHRETLHLRELSEPEMLELTNERIQQLDPDVIEGHNLFNFDLPFLHERARRHGIALTWGRDGSPVRLGITQRVKVGARSVPFQPAAIFGRHIIDTYQQIQRYDTAGELQSYGLKASIDALGLTRQDRAFVPGAEITATWEQDPERILAYALDDVADVATLSSLTVPTEFYQSQVLPRSFQNVATGGPGEKINHLMARVYLGLGHSLPLPEEPRAYPGGFTQLCRVGVFGPVVKCDVESLYPAIMLSDRISPSSDCLGAYLILLDELIERRFEAKRQARLTIGADRARWLGLQSSYKVLVNSFYGYLGYSRALFSDYGAAAQVTMRGQQIIKQIMEELEHAGAESIEVDTDGVYFRPPDHVRDLEGEEAFVARIGQRLPSGINLAHDGSFRGMLSLKTKNYALITRDDRMILKGSSLRNRREEPVFRDFVRGAARRFIDASPDAVRDWYFDIAGRIIERKLPVEAISRWETVTEKTFKSEANRRLASVAAGERIGERLAVYQRADGSLARSDAYDGDEDIDYLLRRLRDMAERFRPLFNDEASFDHHFPRLSARSDLAAVRASRPVHQLPLFG
ncbi:3'-5' exonuclease [Nitrolancea hollandica]|uniref:DNA-directed DNA polymerase n=1 Tax=Nitrolancea hollandica Lb TaxID=1129897 RepID=I4EMC8_9BACT|nr:3'-5' exonuclease [Nitrolancea hollandica]CCF85841.1 DNA polymerase [Nitrolancea hollandica Lb]